MNILSLDIEEPWHTIPRRSDYQESCRPIDLQKFIDRFCSVVDLDRVTPILFVVGTVAERYKSLMRELAESGFILASHGYDHEDFGKLKGIALRRELVRAKSHLEDILGRAVTAFRAPAFSVGDLNQFWAAEREAGFAFDFSVCEAIRFSGGGHAAGFRAPTRLEDYGLWEFPMSVNTILNRSIYVTGGGYFRLCPEFVLSRLQMKLDYNMFYLHPIDFMKPNFVGSDPRSLLQRFRQEVNIGDPWKKLTNALRRQEWHTGSIDTWIRYYE